jgi:hypothetical protein
LFSFLFAKRNWQLSSSLLVESFIIDKNPKAQINTTENLITDRKESLELFEVMYMKKADIRAINETLIEMGERLRYYNIKRIDVTKAKNLKIP